MTNHLLWPARQNDVRRLKKLLASEAYFSERDIKKSLVTAIELGHIEAGVCLAAHCRFALASNYKTVVELAFQYGHLAIVKALVEVGATNVNAVIRQLLPTLLHDAESFRDFVEVFGLHTVLAYVITRRGCHLLARVLDASRADANICWGGKTLLQHACGASSVYNVVSYGVLSSLIERGADPNANPSPGSSALQMVVLQYKYASDRPHVLNCVNLLLDAGANVDHVNHLGKSALWYAVSHGRSWKVVRLLLNRGARVDCIQGWKVLELAVSLKDKRPPPLRNPGLDIIYLLVHAGVAQLSDLWSWPSAMA